MDEPIVGPASAPVPAPEYLLAMKAMAMKIAPERVVTDAADVRFLLQLPGVDRESVRDDFRRHGLLELFDGIEKRT